ncbi:glycoside hydrolase family 78 protein [Fibrella forsythiae]|uniref:alpha-L-rhamnosidase n=1 Tax=Fibrella forsythiae TaxID=2817061 RepID=A0ABS3JD53_9BACT|nr:glycoside hydrolase family 78 protein [Fibrella forsythiae]MBO0947929.1 glycoside hydrolase family 78 protein [Fibrella forsythiae]
MKVIHVIFALLLICTFPVLGMRGAGVTVQQVRCETLTNPEGIDATRPRLSWEISSTKRAIEQTGYQILVASSEEKLAADTGDLWDSGKVTSAQSIQVAYGGKLLKSGMRCFWKVNVWTNQGETGWSKPAHWSMGLLNYLDWKGRWIGLDRAFAWDTETTFSRLSARYFRKEFVATKTIQHAAAYIIGLGLYELYLNGQKVGDQVLAPCPTDYTQGVKYNTFDVTSLLKTGQNAIGTVLGNGRYFAMRQAYKPYKIKTFGYPKLLLNLIITYADGTKDVITTDDSWKATADGPIRTNNEYDGEEYDATKELTNWSRVGFNDKNWLKAEFVQEPGGAYEAQMNENMKVMETIRPVSIKRLPTGTYLLDLGQNMAGWVRMRVKGPRATTVTLRFAESLQANGEPFTRNLRDAKVTDVYTLKGGGLETWEPTFVYHGFRYVEITGFPSVPTINDFDGRVVYDAMPTVGTFGSSNSTLNQIHKNAYWGILSNYKGMPVDCPQRNERQPWLGDRSTGAYGESFLFDNSRLYAKWLTDIEQSQKADGSIPDVAPAFWRYYGDNVTWPGTYLTVADMLYRQFGDLESIRKHYPSMKKWIDYMADRYTTDGLVTKDKYGDWCVPPESKELIHAKDPARQTAGELLASATYIRLLAVMQQFAQLLNKPDDAKAFGAMAAEMKTAFNTKFLNGETAHYGNNTVTANLLPLAYDIVPEAARSTVFGGIVDKIVNEHQGHISTGVIGTQWLMRGLSANGRPDLAYRIASNRDYPSWGYMAENGATTIWELWNGNTANPEMNSGNHVMLLGDLLIWYYENLAGIKSAPDAPAFKKVVMKPDLVDGLDFVTASYQSSYGRIRSDWAKKAGQFTWTIHIPANTKALVYLPATSADLVSESGKPVAQAEGVSFLRMEHGKAVFDIGSGTYQFTCKL